MQQANVPAFALVLGQSPRVRVTRTIGAARDCGTIEYQEVTAAGAGPPAPEESPVVASLTAPTRMTCFSDQSRTSNTLS